MCEMSFSPFERNTPNGFGAFLLSSTRKSMGISFAPGGL